MHITGYRRRTALQCSRKLSTVVKRALPTVKHQAPDFDSLPLGRVFRGSLVRKRRVNLASESKHLIP